MASEPRHRIQHHDDNSALAPDSIVLDSLGMHYSTGLAVSDFALGDFVNLLPDESGRLPRTHAQDMSAAGQQGDDAWIV